MSRWLIAAMLLLFKPATADSVDAIQNSIKNSGLDAPVESIEPGPFSGIYTIKLEGGRVLYASKDGEYFIQGRIHQFSKGRMVNLTAKEERLGIAAAVNNVPEKDFVHFRAQNPRASIIVFTDTSCPFCHRLHNDVEKLNEAGVSVKYLAFPRQGLDSKVYNTMVSVWCSQDRQSALSDAIQGESLDSKSCNNPVEDHFRLGRLIGVKGTPTIIFEDGSLASGYRKPDAIIKAALRN